MLDSSKDERISDVMELEESCQSELSSKLNSQEEFTMNTDPSH